MSNGHGRRQRLVERPAFSLVELLVTIAILSLTTFLAFSVYNPGDAARKDGVRAQLEQLGQAVVLYNLNNPSQPFKGTTENQTVTWWTALGSDFYNEGMSDAWGSMYEHDPDRGLVYSYGENVQDELGDGDDLVYFYRPPSAYVRDRLPSPDSTVSDDTPTISSEWLFRGSTGVTTATIWIDGEAFIPSIAGTSPVTISYTPPGPLPQGAHTVRIRAEDGNGLVGRASWQFKIDVDPPSVYAMQPTSGTITGYRAFPTSAYFQDASGIRMLNDGANGWPRLTVQYSGSPPGPPGYPVGTNTYYGPDQIRTAIPGATVTAGSIALGSPPGGWKDGSYDFSLLLQDTVGNQMGAPASWGFQVKDTSAPFINVQLPEYASKLTSSSDTNPLIPGVQIDVVGATEPSAIVTMNLWHPDTGGVNRWTTGVQADAFGQFRFRDVTLWSWDGTPIPTNTLRIEASDGVNPTVSVDHVVYLFDESSNVDLVYALATPQTTRPNEPMIFSAGATGGSTPYEFTFEFDDGYELTSVVYQPFVTDTNTNQFASVSHTYIETGSYSVTIRVQDANGLEDSQLLSVYIGTESQSPDIRLEPVPGEIAYGIPGADKTNFNITINGKFLGSWRLKVDNSPFAFRDTRWWYTGDNKWVEFAQESLDPEAPNTLWQQAASNNFSVEWFGQDNTDYGDVREVDEGPPGNAVDLVINGNINRGFDGNNFALIPMGDAHIATLDYRDAFGQTSKVTAPIVLFNDTPRPSTIRVWSVNGDENSPELFDEDFDGLWDYTRSKRVDLRIPQPPTSNNTDLWISNYPVDMHYFTESTFVNPLTTFAFDIPGNALVNRGEVFQNLTLADGEFFDATDGSSGWIPYRADDLYRNWDLTADMINLGFPSASQPWVPRIPGSPIPCPDPLVMGGGYPGSGKSTADCPHNIFQGDFWSAGEGVALDSDGAKVIYAIFRSVGPFISTQGGSNDSSPHTSGVTAASIFLDRTPPVSTQGIELVDINVIRSPIGQDFVVAKFDVLAVDSPGSGMFPRGRAVIKIPGQPDILLPYNNQIEVTLGNFADLADSATGNIVVTATIVFEDNLSNRSTPVSSTSSLSNISLDLIQYEWSLIGAGDLYYFQATLEPDPSLTNAGLIDHNLINSQTDDGGGPYDTQAWFDADTNTVPTGSRDGAVQVAETNIDPVNFPNPDDRLGVLQAVRPPTDANFFQAGSLSGGTVEAQQTFPVEAGKCYVMQLERDQVSGEVEYVVRERGVEPTYGTCEGWEQRIGTSPTGTIVAETDKVVNKAAQRFNFGRLLLPRDVGAGGTNIELGRHADMHRNDNGQFDSTDVWDNVRDLIQSSDPLAYKTYPFRGVVGEFDSGTVGDIDYLVSIDNFRLRAFFVENPAWDLTAATGPHGPDGIHLTDPGTAEPPGVLGVKPRYVKVAPWNAPGSGLPGPPENFGFGPAGAGSAWWDATEVIDDPEATGGGAALSGVGGKRFRIKFADQSQGFEPITSGALSAAGYVMFDQAGGTDWNDDWCGVGSCQLFGRFEAPGAATPTMGDGDVGRFVFKYLGPGYVYTNTPAVPVNPSFSAGIAADPFDPALNGTPLEHNLPDLPVDLHMKWDYLAGREGTMRLVVAYQDQYQNQIGTVVKDYAVDASPPRIDGLELRGDYFNYQKFSSPPQNWTSNTAVHLWVDGQEGSDVFREFIPGDNTNSPVLDIDVDAAPVKGCAAPDVGQSPGPGTCDPSNWYLFAAGGLTAGTPVTELLQLTGAASEGPVTATFRFRDAFYNHVPDFTLAPVGDTTDDGPDGAGEAEPAITTWIYYDTMNPEITRIEFKAIDSQSPLGDPTLDYPDIRSNTPTRSQVLGKWWINERFPAIEFDAEDRSGCSPKCSSGMDQAGVNGYLTVNGTASGPGTADFPAVYAYRRPAAYPGEVSGDPFTNRTFDVNPTGGSSTCDEASVDDCFTGAMEQYALSPFGTTDVFPNNFFKLFATDNVGRGGTAVGDSYVYLEFGYDSAGPTINAGTLGMNLSYTPQNRYEEMTMAAGGIGYTEGGATIQVHSVIISIDNPVVGSTDSITINQLDLYEDGVAAPPIVVGATISVDDPDSYVIELTGLPGNRADEIRLNATNVSGTPTVRIRVLTSAVRDGVLDQTDTVTQAPGGNYPAGNPYINTSNIGVDWADITVCASDGSGVGLHATDETDGDTAGLPWEVSERTGQPFLAQQPSQVVLDYSTGGEDGLTVTPQLKAVDRLRNQGPAVSLFTTTIDRTEPLGVTGFTVRPADVADTFGGAHPLNGVPITGVQAFATFTNSTDAGAGMNTHHVYRAFATSPDTRATADVVSSMHIATQANGAPAFSLRTFRAGGQDDGLYQFAVYPEDLAKVRNESLTAGNTVDLLVDATGPETTGAVTLQRRSPADPNLWVRSRAGTTAQVLLGCGVPPAAMPPACDDSWTNDPQFGIHFRVEDLAFNQASAAHQADPGSGMKTLAFQGINGTSGTGSVNFGYTMAATPNIAGTPYTSLGVPHGFDVAIQPVQEFGVAGRLPLMDPVTDDRYYVQWTASDRASNAGSPVATYFQYDTTGPTWGGVATGDIAITFWDGVNAAGCTGTVYPFDLAAEGGLGADITVPSTAACIRVAYPGVRINDRASDPGYPNTGIGVDYNAATMPGSMTLYRGWITAGAGHTFRPSNLTDNEFIDFEPPSSGTPEFRLHIRDLLGNESAGIRMFGFILDTTPPTGDLVRVCGDSTCSGASQLEDLSVWPTTATPAVGRKLNLADMNDTNGEPGGCPVIPGCNNDDTNWFWIRGNMNDPGGGFNLLASDTLEVTFANEVESTNCVYTVDGGALNSDVWFDYSLPDTALDADNVVYYVRLPKPGTGPLASCANTYWDDHLGTVDDVTWNIQVVIKDKGGNTDTISHWGRIDVRAPTGFNTLDYEKNGSNWANEDLVDAGGWTVTGVLNTTDLAANPQIRVTNAGAAVNGIVWQTTGGTNPNYTTTFTSVNVGDVQNNNLQIEMQATDIYGNTGTATPQTGVKLDTVDPICSLLWQPASSTSQTDCGAPLDHTLDANCAAEPYMDTVELEWDIQPDTGITWVSPGIGATGAQDVTAIDSGYGAGTNPAPYLGPGSPEWNIFGAAYDGTAANERYTFRVIGVDQAGNVESTGLPAGSPGDAQYLVPGEVQSQPSNWDVDEDGVTGWLNIAQNSDGWYIHGDWADCIKPLNVEIRITGDGGEWAGTCTSWQNIISGNGSCVTGGAINNTGGLGSTGVGEGWEVTIPSALYSSLEDNSVTIEVRLENGSFGFNATPWTRTVQVDTIAPNSYSIDSWEETPAGIDNWVKAAAIVDNTWTIQGTVVDTYLDPSQFPKITIRNTANAVIYGPTAVGAIGGSWVAGTDVWTLPIDATAAPFNTLEDKDLRIQVDAVDQAGNTGLPSQLQSFGGAGSQDYRYDVVVPTSQANIVTADPGCAPWPDMDLDGQCSDGFCDTLQLFWAIGAGGYAATPPGSLSAPLNLNPQADSAGPPHFTVAAASISTAGETYRFYTRATDEAGNVEAAPGSADETIVIAAAPVMTVDNWEQSGSWVNKAENDDNWAIDGTWTSCAIPNNANSGSVEIRIMDGAATLLNWTDIQSGGSLSNPSITGAGSGTWSVEVAPAILGGTRESNTITIDVRGTNTIGTGAPVSSGNIQVDTYPPRALAITDIDDTNANTWISLNEITTGGGWTIQGEADDKYMAAGYPRIAIVDGGAEPDIPITDSDNWTPGLPGTWDITISNATIGSRETNAITIQVYAQDQAGNQAAAFPFTQAGVKLDNVLPLSTASNGTADPGCAAWPNTNVNVACTDDFCSSVELFWDAAGGTYALMPTGNLVGATNPVPFAGNPHFQITAASLASPGDTFYFYSRATDQAGNVETAVPGAPPSTDFSISVAADPTVTITAWEEDGGWVDKSENDDGWVISGTWNSCGIPNTANSGFIEIKIDSATAGGGPELNWANIQGGGVLSSPTIAGTPPSGTWSVTVAQSVLGTLEATDVIVEARADNQVSNPQGPTYTHPAISFDTQLPTISCNSVTNDGTESNWVNLAHVAGNNWTISGAVSDGYLAAGFPEVRVTDNTGTTPLGNLDWVTASTPVGWSHNVPTANITGGNAVNNIADARVYCAAEDSAGNRAEVQSTANPIKIDTTAPAASTADNIDAQEPTENCTGAENETYSVASCANTWSLRWRMPDSTTAFIGDATRATCATNINVASGSFSQGGAYDFVSITYDQAGNPEGGSATSKDPVNASSETQTIVGAAPTVAISSVEGGGVSWVGGSNLSDGVSVSGTWNNGPLSTQVEVKVFKDGAAWAGWGGDVWRAVNSGGPYFSGGSSGTLSNSSDSWSATLAPGIFAGQESLNFTVYVRITAVCGGTTATDGPDTFWIDAVAPNMTGAQGWTHSAPAEGTAWMNSGDLPLSVGGDLVEAGSGVSSVDVKINCSGGAGDLGGGFLAASTPGTSWSHTYGGGSDVDREGAGQTGCGIVIQATDNAGNTSGTFDSRVHGTPPASGTFKVDTVAPTFTTDSVSAVSEDPVGGSGIHNIAGVTGNSGITVTYTFADSGSGLDPASGDLNWTGGPAGCGTTVENFDPTAGSFTYSDGNLSSCDGQNLNVQYDAVQDLAGNTLAGPTAGSNAPVDMTAPANPGAGDVNVVYGGGSGRTNQTGQAPGDMAPGAGGPLLIGQSDSVDFQVTCGLCRYATDQAAGNGVSAPADCASGSGGPGGTGVWTAGVELADTNIPGVAVLNCDAASNPSAGTANWYHDNVQP